MVDKAFVNADGDLLVVPETGALDILTELGRMLVSPGELFVLPRGLKMTVKLASGVARGWVCEPYNRHFVIPDRGPVGSNLLADRRHFLTPTAWFEDREVPGGFRVWTKFGGNLHEYVQGHSPFDVVAWHGEYVPYKYPMLAFSPVGAVKVSVLAPHRTARPCVSGAQGGGNPTVGPSSPALLARCRVLCCGGSGITSTHRLSRFCLCRWTPRATTW